MNLLNLLPKSVVKILALVQNNGFELTLVGGAVRDFYKDQILSKDLDFEVRSKTLTSYDELKAELTKNNIEFELLPYQILKIPHGEFDLEFSAPRIEEDLPGETGHHHFVARTDFNLSHAESFKRRDFTINSMGLMIDVIGKKELLVDPFNGMTDLKNKELVHVNSSFTSDYVRFLRLIRFSVKYNFNISVETKKIIKNFDLSGLTHHYLKTELLKSRNAKAFLDLLFFYVQKDRLNMPEKFIFLKDLKLDVPVCSPSTHYKDDLIASAYLNNDKDTAQKFALLMSMAINSFKDMESFYASYLVIKNHVFNQKLTQDLETIEDLSYFKDLKNYFEKYKWQNFLNLTKLYTEEDYNNIKIDNLLMDKTSKDKRSFLKCFIFYKNAYEKPKL